MAPQLPNSPCTNGRLREKHRCIVMRMDEDSSAYWESFKRVECTNWEYRRVRATHQLWRTEWNQYTPPTTLLCRGYNKACSILWTNYMLCDIFVPSGTPAINNGYQHNLNMMPTCHQWGLVVFCSIKNKWLKIKHSRSQPHVPGAMSCKQNDLKMQSKSHHRICKRSLKSHSPHCHDIHHGGDLSWIRNGEKQGIKTGIVWFA